MTLRYYKALADKWERDLIRNFDKVLGLTDNEAMILVHLWRNKGSYKSRIIRLLKIKRTTVFYVLERLTQENVIFRTSSPVTGYQVYKNKEGELSRAYLAAAFKMCICEQLKQGADEDEIFNQVLKT